MLKKQVVPLL